jgi:hypothetical protein
MLNPILEVAIGVILVFLVVAVMVSSVTELISGAFRVRARTLERGIEAMLGKSGKQWLYSQPLITTSKPPARAVRSLNPVTKTKPPSYLDAVTFSKTLVAGLSAPTSETLLARLLPTDAAKRVSGALPKEFQRVAAKLADNPYTLSGYLLDKLWDHTLEPNQVAGLLDPMDALREDRDRIDTDDPARAQLDVILTGATDPTAVVVRIRDYSPPLATPALGDLLKGRGLAPLDGRIRNVLAGLAQRADADIASLRENVEDWFDREMDRVSGVYNRWSQVVMVIIALAIAAGVNVSAYTVGRSLWVDQSLRARFVAAAEQTVTTATTTPGSSGPSQSSTATTSPATTSGSTSATTVPPTPSYRDLKSFGLPIGWSGSAWPTATGDIILHILGWVVVAIAASFGAPFWFDTLNRFVNLRTSGPPPATAADQRATTAALSKP